MAPEPALHLIHRNRPVIRGWTQDYRVGCADSRVQTRRLR